jgi:hypothetical protein
MANERTDAARSWVSERYGEAEAKAARDPEGGGGSRSTYCTDWRSLASEEDGKTVARSARKLEDEGAGGW